MHWVRDSRAPIRLETHYSRLWYKVYTISRARTKCDDYSLFNTRTLNNLCRSWNGYLIELEKQKVRLRAQCLLNYACIQLLNVHISTTLNSRGTCFSRLKPLSLWIFHKPFSHPIPLRARDTCPITVFEWQNKYCIYIYR